MRLSAAFAPLPSALGLALGGYAGPPRVARSEARPLEACVLRAVDEEGGEAFVIGLDLLFVGPVLDARLKRSLAPAKVLTIASHTHSAPSTDPTKPALGAFAAAWTDGVAEVVEALAAELRAAPASGVALGRAESPLGLSINRRRVWPLPTLGRRGVQPPGVRMAPNPDGPRADLARVAVVTDIRGAPTAVIWSWACHATSPVAPGALSSDFPGAVRAALRAALGETPVLFLQGFAGDVRPPGRPAGPIEAGLALLRGPRFIPMTTAETQAWEAALGDAVRDLAHRAADASAPISGRVGARTMSVPLSGFLEGAPIRAMALGRLDLGDSLALVHVEAEPCAAHADAVARLAPGAWPIGYAGDVFGYLPTDRQAREGGYEATGYMPLFAMSGRYGGSIDEALAGALIALTDAPA